MRVHADMAIIILTPEEIAGGMTPEMIATARDIHIRNWEMQRRNTAAPVATTVMIGDENTDMWRYGSFGLEEIPPPLR